MWIDAKEYLNKHLGFARGKLRLNIGGRLLVKVEEKAIELHEKGYNCAQSVLCAFTEKNNMEEKDLFRISEAFGFGMGSQEVCGAVAGVCFLAGLANSDGNIENPRTKKQTYKIAKTMIDEFKEKNKSINCYELLGGDLGIPFKSCNEYIKDACIIAEKCLYNKER